MAGGAPLLFVGTNKSFVCMNGTFVCMNETNHLFVGTQDLCVQSNKTGSNKTMVQQNDGPTKRFPSGWLNWMERWIGLDAKILRPYKQMFHPTIKCFILQSNVPSHKQMFHPTIKCSIPNEQFAAEI
jgi:hypothetical protein